MSKQLTVVDEVKKNLSRMEKQFALVLPDNVTPKKFIRVAQTAVQKNADLSKASQASLYAACMQCAQDGLLPDGKEAALICYGSTAQYMPMVAGIKKKVRASGEVKSWQLRTVHENDLFDYEEGDNARIFHKPALSNRGEVIAAYSIVTYKDGEKDREVIGREEIDKIRASSKSPNAGPWKNWYEEMAKKSVAKRHAKSLPMGDALSHVIHADDEDKEGKIIDIPADPEALEVIETHKKAPQKEDKSSRLNDAISEQPNKQSDIPI